MHLGPDESYVVTDYVIAPSRVIKQRRPLTASRQGETTEIVVRRLGGRLIENGLEMATGVDIYPESESFKVADEVVVFLQDDISTHVYLFISGPFGAFRVQGSRVQPMTRETAIRRGDTPKDETSFIDELVRLSR